MDPKEDGKEGLDGFKVAVGAQAVSQSPEERVEVQQRREGSELEVRCGGRERFEVFKE